MSIENATDYSRRTRRRIHVYGAIFWPAFLSASVASVVFFAFIDPATLHEQSLPGMALSREAGYGIGFLVFWAICALSSALTLLLSRLPRSQRR